MTLANERMRAALREIKSRAATALADQPKTTTGADGATWRTVRLISAYKSDDGKLCVIEIAPIEGGAE